MGCSGLGSCYWDFRYILPLFRARGVWIPLSWSSPIPGSSMSTKVCPTPHFSRPTFQPPPINTILYHALTSFPNSLVDWEWGWYNHGHIVRTWGELHLRDCNCWCNCVASFPLPVLGHLRYSGLGNWRWKWGYEMSWIQGRSPFH